MSWIPTPNIILPHLILGGDNVLDDVEEMKKLNVKYVLCCAPECMHEMCTKGKSERFAKVQKISIADFVPKGTGHQHDTFEKAFAFIDQAVPKSKQNLIASSSLNENTTTTSSPESESSSLPSTPTSSAPVSQALAPETVYVHCMRGRSRSATVVIGYLMTRHGMSLRDAYIFVKLRRPFIGPHHYMRKQLITFELSLMLSGFYSKGSSEQRLKTSFPSFTDLRDWNKLEHSTQWDSLVKQNEITKEQEEEELQSAVENAQHTL